MFKVVVNDGTQELPDDDIYYIVSKEGVFLKKKMGVMESIAPVKNISILNSIDSMARMHINPIPAQTGAKILEFFKAVHDKFAAEAIVLLFYHKASGKYRVVAPKQKVTGASLDYEREVQVPGFQMIGTIHSHGSMSAFHSGTDDDDEKSFDGLHITYGQVNQEEFSLSASIVANGHRFMVDPEDYMLGLSKTKDVDEKAVNYATKVYKMVNGKMQLDEKASSRTAYTTRKFDKRFVFNVPPSKRRFNEAWMDNVEKGTYTYYYGNYGLGGAYDWRAGNYWNQNRGGKRHWGKWWGQGYDRQAWNQVGRGTGYVAPANQKALPPPVGGKVGAGTTKPVKDETRPCLTCKHRDCKIMDEMNDIEYEEEMFVCKKCNSIIETEDLAPVCPNCKTDDFLISVEEDKLIDNYEEHPNAKDENDRESYLNSAQSMQPDQMGKETCLQCGNDFVRLESDETCPYCSTLLPDTVPADELEWECPYCQGTFGESELVIDNHCPHCNGLLDLTPGEPETLVCPVCKKENTIQSLESVGCCYSCGSPALGINDGYSSEQALQDQSDKDSGVYLYTTEDKEIPETDSGVQQYESEEKHTEILKAAAEADKNLERIPDPEKGPNQPAPLTTTAKIKDAMMRVFGGKKGNDTIH